MAPRETENNAYAKFWVTNKEHYGMLWYFWSGQLLCQITGNAYWIQSAVYMQEQN